jgi:hypothetical protein
MDPKEEIRFRVVAETFTDTTPSGPNNDTIETALDSKENKRTPYLITVSSDKFFLIFFFDYLVFSCIFVVSSSYVNFEFFCFFRPL